MNESLAAFIVSRPEGLLDSADVQTLVALDPLCLVAVRCEGGMFLAPARYVAHFISLLERDERETVLSVAIPEDKQREAQAWRKCKEWPDMPVLLPITTKLAKVPQFEGVER